MKGVNNNNNKKKIVNEYNDYKICHKTEESSMRWDAKDSVTLLLTQINIIIMRTSGKLRRNKKDVADKPVIQCRNYHFHPMLM